MFDSVFTNKQIKTTVLNLLKDIKDFKQQPKKLMRPLLNDIFFKKGKQYHHQVLLKNEPIF